MPNRVTQFYRSFTYQEGERMLRVAVDDVGSCSAGGHCHRKLWHSVYNVYGERVGLRCPVGLTEDEKLGLSASGNIGIPVFFGLSHTAPALWEKVAPEQRPRPKEIEEQENVQSDRELALMAAITETREKLAQPALAPLFEEPKP